MFSWGEDLWNCVLGFLNVKERTCLAAVCKSFRNAHHSTASPFWRDGKWSWSVHSGRDDQRNALLEGFVSMQAYKLGLPSAPISHLNDELCWNPYIRPTASDEQVLCMLVKYHQTLEHFQMHQTRPSALSSDLVELARQVPLWKLSTLSLIFDKSSINQMVIVLLVLPRASQTLRSLTLDCTYCFEEGLAKCILDCSHLQELSVCHLYKSEVCSFPKLFWLSLPRANESVTSLRMSGEEIHELGQVSPRQVRDLPRYFSGLKDLSIGVRNFDTELFSTISQVLPDLKNLSLFNCGAEEDDLVDMSVLVNMADLETIQIEAESDNGAYQPSVGVSLEHDEGVLFPCSELRFEECSLQEPAKWMTGSVICRTCTISEPVWQGGPNFPNLDLLKSLHLEGDIPCHFEEAESLIIRGLPSLQDIFIRCFASSLESVEIMENDLLTELDLSIDGCSVLAIVKIYGDSLKKVELDFLDENGNEPEELELLELELPVCEKFCLDANDSLIDGVEDTLQTMVSQLTWEKNSTLIFGTAKTIESRKRKKRT